MTRSWKKWFILQFAEVEDFLELMVAAQALPHTDYKRYPTVMEKSKEMQKILRNSYFCEAILEQKFQIAVKSKHSMRQLYIWQGRISKS